MTFRLNAFIRLERIFQVQVIKNLSEFHTTSFTACLLVKVVMKMSHFMTAIKI